MFSLRRMLRRGRGTQAASRLSRRERLDAIRAAKDTYDTAVRDALAREVRNRPLAEGSPRRRQQLEELLELAEPRHISHGMARRLERHKLSLRSGLSFQSIMLEQSEARGLGAFRPGWLLDNKPNAYAFVDEIGVRRPECDREPRHLGEIEPASPLMLKPVRSTGSRAAYAVFSPKHIVHLYDRTILRSWEEMAESARVWTSDHQDRSLPDRWMTEELIFEDRAAERPARDVKFYAFYGEVVLIQESTRIDGFKVCFWDRNGAQVKTGRYEDTEFDDGRGVTDSELSAISEISAQIPVPFMRIDMLRGEHELVLGEFTPRPGHFHEFNRDWNRIFGEAWVRAEGRIIEDVLAGKDFAAFAKATNRR